MAWKTLTSIASVAALAAGAGVSAPLDCPVVPEVLARAGTAARTVSIENLGTRLSDTIERGGDLHLIANRLKMEMPRAQEAEIADVMIAAYCQHLSATPPNGRDPAQVLARFEQDVYGAVFEAPTQEHERGGWLYN